MTLQFSLSVEQWVDQQKARSEEAFRATALDAVSMVKSLTPVKTGFLRANWTVIRNNDQIPMPSAEQHPEAVIASLRLGDMLLIVNPVPYAARVNYGFVGVDSLGRHYDQKGVGMLEQTIAMLPEIARLAAQRVNSGGT